MGLKSVNAKENEPKWKKGNLGKNIFSTNNALSLRQHFYGVYKGHILPYDITYIEYTKAIYYLIIALLWNTEATYYLMIALLWNTEATYYIKTDKLYTNMIHKISGVLIALCDWRGLK